MHYGWKGFITSEANAAGLSTMSDLDGNAVQKPEVTRMSTVDIQQLAGMYSGFCKAPAVTTCDDGQQVYLSNFVW